MPEVFIIECSSLVARMGYIFVFTGRWCVLRVLVVA